MKYIYFPINKKEDYEVLKRTIAILIADFEIPGLKELGYYTDWKLIETESRKVILTDTIEIVINLLTKVNSFLKNIFKMFLSIANSTLVLSA